MLIDREKSIVVLIDVQEKLFPLIDKKEEVLTHCDWVLSLARALDIPLWVSEQYPKGLGETIEPLQKYLPGSERYIKSTFSCVADGQFSSALEKQNRDQFILIGIETHACVLGTALELLEQEKEVFIVKPACGSRHSHDRKLALKRMQQQGAQILSPEMLFFEWIRDSGSNEFKALSKQFL